MTAAIITQPIVAHSGISRQEDEFMRHSAKWYQIATLVAGSGMFGFMGCTMPEVGGLILAATVAVWGVWAAYFLQPTV